MAFVYSPVASLKDKDKVGSHQCVALVQFYAAGIPHTSAWKQGDAILGNTRISTGTAIATFVNGRYLSNPHGNHAAFFLRNGANGFGWWTNGRTSLAVTSVRYPSGSSDRWVGNRTRMAAGHRQATMPMPFL